MSRPFIPVELRFWDKVDKSGDCWEWTASRGTSGYGQIRANGRPVVAHRVAYELTHGAVPEGVELDHLCHNRGCVNPDHLRVVSHKENMENLRGAHTDSTTGVRNVDRLPSGNYRVVVCHFGKRYRSSHPTLEAAAAAAEALRAELHSHVRGI